MKKRFLVACGLATALSVGSAQAVVLINEIDADQTATDSTEFIELYNTNGAPVDLAAGGYVLVLFNGSNDLSYRALDLTGTIPANGFYVIGSATVTNVDQAEFTTDGVQNGADAVALYSGTTAASIPNNTLVGDVTETLVDAVVYGTSDADAVNLIATLTPGQPQVDENSNGAAVTESSQRVPDGAGGALNTGSFVQAAPTPGTTNAATTDPIISVNVSAINFGRFNAPNTGSPADRTITISNTGVGTLEVSTFELNAGSDAVFSAGAPSIGLPAALGNGESVSVVVSFENGANATDTFAGTVDYVTDAPENASGSVTLAASYVQILDTVNAGDVLINEICYNPNPGSPNPIIDYNNDGVADSNQDEWVELYNKLGVDIRLDGWELSTASGTVILPANTTLTAANPFIVLFRGGTPNLPGVNALANGPVLGNSGATVVVSDGTTVIDSVSYILTETGAITESAATSQGGSIGRSQDGLEVLPRRGDDTFIEFEWDSVTFPPSPGTSNDPTSVSDWNLY